MERRVFFLCLLSFLMFAEGSSWMMAGGLGPCLVKPGHAQQTANHNEHEDCPTFFAGSLLTFDRGFEWIKRDDNDKGVVAGFTVVLAISTIGLWLATIKLWRAGETQRLLAEDTAERQLRAYVSIGSGVVFKQKRNISFEFRANLINNGNTPAKDVRIVSNIGLVPPDIPEGFDYSLPAQMGGSASDVGPRQQRIHSMVYSRKLTRAQLRRILRGEWIFHLYGTVRYLDVFEKSKTTNFSFTVFLGRKRDTPIWHYTERNNHAD
jgi:hypothetical protein